MSNFFLRPSLLTLRSRLAARIGPSGRLSGSAFCVLLMLPLIFATGTVLGQEAAEYVKGYGLGTLKYAEIKNLLDKLRTRKGSISHIKASNRILVYDVPAVHKQVRKLLTAGKGPIINILIDVDFINIKSFRDRGIKLAWNYGDGSSGRFKVTGTKAKGGRVKLKGPDGVKVDDFGSKKSQELRFTRQSIMTASGSAARLWTTKTALDKTLLENYELVPFEIGNVDGRIVVIEAIKPEIIVRELGSSLWVLPTYLASGLVRVEVFPVVSYEMMDGKTQSFRVEKVQTTVVVRPGCKFYIGGGNKNTRTFMKDLFGTEFRRGARNDNLSMYLTPHVQILDPTRRRRGDSLRHRRSEIWRHFPD